MTMKTRRFLFVATLLMALSQVTMASGWRGSGTEADPYQIREVNDWKDIHTAVLSGETQKGVVFRLIGNITVPISHPLGSTDEYCFEGTIDGDGHTITIDSQSGADNPMLANYMSPFGYVKGATFRHLTVAGTMYTKGKYTASFAGYVVGGATTTFIDCTSTVKIYSTTDAADASHGGFVGYAETGATLDFDRCSFRGQLLTTWQSNAPTSRGCSGFVGENRGSATLSGCMYDPEEDIDSPWQHIIQGSTFARCAGEGVVTMTSSSCYTGTFSDAQGMAVFKKIGMPEGCTYTMMTDPMVNVDGERYWTSGALVKFTLDEERYPEFAYWDNLNSFSITEPFTKDGVHQINDLTTGYPAVTIRTAMPVAKDVAERNGVKYRYLSKDDYLLYVTKRDVFDQGWYFNDKDYLCVKDGEGTEYYVTAITGYDSSVSTFNQTLSGRWLWSDDQFTGTAIPVDLVGSFTKHTHVGVIAPHAFDGCQELRRVTFISDIDETSVYHNDLGVELVIGQGAFANCPNLEAIDMMYYNYTGTDHWEAIAPTQIIRIADDAFDGSANCRVLVDPSEYQKYLNSSTWTAHQHRLGIFSVSMEDIKAGGAVYSYMRDSQSHDPLKNDAAGHASMKKTILNWNSLYKKFNATDLLAQQDYKNIWYTRIVGVDDSSLDDGKMTIYNDVGTYYNYKNVAIAANAFKDNLNLKKIGFAQVQGDYDSYSSPKMVIENGAFAGCKNLEEISLFYWCQDGEDHWESLGPEDIIPGDNIFGVPTSAEIQAASAAGNDLTIEQLGANLPKNLKILVSPSRYNDFLNDLNWAPYVGYLEPVEYDPTNKKTDFTVSGLTYGYVTNPGSILQTSQTVSQDVSWWTLPRIALEVAMTVYSVYNWYSINYGAGSLDHMALNTSLADNQNNIMRLEEGLEADNNLLRTCNNGTAKLDYITKNQVASADDLFEAGKGLDYNEFLFNIKVDDDAREELLKSGLLSIDGYWNNKVQYYQRALENGKGALVVDVMKQSISRQKSTAENAITAANNAIKQGLANEHKWVVRSRFLSLFLHDYSFFTLTSVPTSIAAFLAAQAWGGSGTYNGDALRKGMRENILSNIYGVGSVGGGYVYTTPHKNLVYHTYIKNVADDIEDAVIYTGTDKGQGANASAVTTTFSKKAFQNKKKLKRVWFHENTVSTNEAVPMVLTIPDSAFVGCDNLQELRLYLETKSNGFRPMGPESFVLAGDSIFAGMDSTKFHIVIDESRRDDFLSNASWAPLQRFFTYETVLPTTQHIKYGVEYAYVYESGSLQKVHKESGHKIEHLLVNGVNNTHLLNHSGTAMLINDVGDWNNYQLDYIGKHAFRGNQYLRTVQFMDIDGVGPWGDCYTGLDVTLQDSCFADCDNLKSVDLLYCVTDQPNFLTQLTSFNFTSNRIDPMTPQQIKVGSGVFDRAYNARFKMMPKQMGWFEADSTWAAYKDRFLPSVIQPCDDGVKAALKDLRYHNASGSSPEYWDDYLDLANLPMAGPEYTKYDFSWLDGKFTAQKDKIRTFADFQLFQYMGLQTVRESWFDGCSLLNNILLPSTVSTIDKRAFADCSSLLSITLPENVDEINDQAFAGCTALNEIHVGNDSPARLGSDVFNKHDGLKIYVPDESLNTYKDQWEEYKDYIFAESTYNINKVVTVTEPGQLASKLGLNVVKRPDIRKEMGSDEFCKVIVRVEGNYSKYDSLTIIGPINAEDLAVIRHMSGADAYDSDPTDGRLKYLNLWNADIKKDLVNIYNANWIDEMAREDNKVPDYLFENCASIETVILPKSATKIGENIFEDATSLKRLCVGYKTTEYECDILQNLTGIEELVLLTDEHASSTYSDPWEADIAVIYTNNKCVGEYLGDTYVTTRAHTIMAPFEDDEVMRVLAERGEHFPSSYLNRKDVEGLFNHVRDLRRFNDFKLFGKVETLGDNSFSQTYNIQTISLPASIKSISAGAFSQCFSLDSIYVSCDSVPELAQDAFESLPNSFRIFVPKELAKIYREKWAQYADHIYVDKDTYTGEKTVIVTLTEPNTLAEKLGLWTSTSWNNNINAVRGDFSRIRKLKIIGPISGHDLDVLKYMAGYCPWTQYPNLAGKLEYLDLYDANIVESTWTQGTTSGNIGNLAVFTRWAEYYVPNNILPKHAFLKCTSLRTLVLPKTCKSADMRALQECNYLETLVLGDDMETLPWNALDDDANLTRMYLLGKKKIDVGEWVTSKMWDKLCNNYNPTFDAFYVVPSLLQEYRSDPTFTSNSWQRTNNIQCGDFTDDEAFRAFVSHGAGTSDDLVMVNDVRQWFNNFPTVNDLTALGYTSVDSLDAETMSPLTDLRQIAMPMTLENIEDGTFSNSPNLRWADMTVCDSTNVISKLDAEGLERVGINTQQTLVYVPSTYIHEQGTNVVVAGATGMEAEKYNLPDKLDYCVPYGFNAKEVTFDRPIVPSVITSVCLPFDVEIPSGVKAYELKGRENSVLVFKQVTDKMKAGRPYVVTAVDNEGASGAKAFGAPAAGEALHLTTSGDVAIPISEGATADQVSVVGAQLSGTFNSMSNSDAASKGFSTLNQDLTWSPVSASASETKVTPFTAYLTTDAITTLQSRLEDDVDAIDQIRVDDEDGSSRYYDLNGRLLPGKPQKGMYIHNGKKVIAQ